MGAFTSETPPHRRTGLNTRELSVVLVVFSLLAGLISMVSPVSLTQFFQAQRESASVLAAHNLSLALFSSAIEHSNTYPVGAVPSSSTSMFQLLLNQGYLQDPWEVYLSGPGKVPPGGTNPPPPLKPENVGWDYMEQRGYVPLAGTTPSDTPLLISTGLDPQSLADGSNEVAVPSTAIWGSDGVTIAYFDQSSRFIRAHGGEPHSIKPPAKALKPSYPVSNKSLVEAEKISPALAAKAQSDGQPLPTSGHAISIPAHLKTQPPQKTSIAAIVHQTSFLAGKGAVKRQMNSIPTSPQIPTVNLTAPYYRTEGGAWITVQP